MGMWHRCRRSVGNGGVSLELDLVILDVFSIHFAIWLLVSGRMARWGEIRKTALCLGGITAVPNAWCPRHSLGCLSPVAEAQQTDGDVSPPHDFSPDFPIWAFPICLPVCCPCPISLPICPEEQLTGARSISAQLQPAPRMCHSSA